MRRQSPKTAAIYRKMKKPRMDFLQAFYLCWSCSALSCCVDEILRGKNRMIAFQERCCWFSACAYCNTGCLTDAAEWPVEKKLAMKLIRDPENFDLDRVNEIYGAGTRYPACEVLRWAAIILAERNAGSIDMYGLGSH